MSKAEDDWVTLTGPVSAQAIRDLGRIGNIDKLSVTQDSCLTTELAQAFRTLKSVKQLWLWCDVTPPAMQHVTSVPDLRVLDVLHIRRPGHLKAFRNAGSLEQFRCNTGLTERDLLSVCTCRSLREIGAQSATLSQNVIEALLHLPALQSIDIEGSNFNDEMANQIGTSKRLRSLDIGATRITRSGLDAISRMEQLTSLDLWATNITENDLDLLARLPHLEHLSLGNVEGVPSFDASAILPKLLSLPSLKRIWLDGIALHPDQRATFEAKCNTVRVT